MESITPDWPPVSVGASVSSQERELLPDEHRQLDVSDLPEDTVSERSSPTVADAFPEAESADGLSEDITLANESNTVVTEGGIAGTRVSDPLADLRSIGQSNLQSPGPPPMVRAASLGFDEVVAATPSVPSNNMPLGTFSSPGSLIDIQPMGDARAATPVVDNGPIPFFQQSEPLGAVGGVDFFASLPGQQPSIRVENSETGASSTTSSQQPYISPVTSSPSGPSPSGASIISLETATMTGQKPSVPANSIDVNAAPPSHAAQFPISAAATTLMPATQPLFAANFDILNRAHLTTSKVPQATAVLDPKYQNLPTKRWTDPSVFYDIPPRDPIGEIFPKAFPVDTGPRPARKILRVDDVASESDPFLALIDANSWRSVAILARQRLIATHPTQVKEIMRLWFVRLTALARLKLFEFASSELHKVGATDLDPPNLRYEKYLDVFPNANGSMLSFEIRLFWARIPSFKGHHQESINRMYKLLYICRRMVQQCKSGSGKSEDEPESVWRNREGQIQLQIANLLLDLKDHRAASAVLRAVSQSRASDANLLSALGRVHLQMGNVTTARDVFQRVSDLVSKDVSQSARHDLVLSNRAFLHMAEGEWESAVNCLTQLLGLNPTSVVCVNNLALCQLYTGNVGQAVSFLDSIAIDMPRKAGVCEELLFNLCSLYDLTDMSVERKRKLLGSVVSRFAGDDFDPACLKL
ncbi:hypothetical protein SpCBS45565_g01058 [Spizellomyces sp. 'palustris']|nr:hypothetical protein SpCBS45565_g01058 [Spizellomyces sp. 'palustris']